MSYTDWLTDWLIDWLIDWCLTPTLAIFQLYRGVTKFIIKQVLIDCVDVADVRQTFYNVNNLYDLFINVAGDTIVKFLKEILIDWLVLNANFSNISAISWRDQIYY
jgi:hypothetical protein